MNKTKETFVFGFALFAGFFGAGNLIIPPMLGYNSGSNWWLVALGFILTTVLIPMLSILAHARLQGTLFDFGKKVSPLFNIIFCFSLLLIAIALPCPRTAAVTHEIAIQPYFNVSALITSSIYFILVFIFAINRNQVLNLIGKYLTPIIVVIVFLIITIGIATPSAPVDLSEMKFPIVVGLLEGYQTYDALAGMVMGGIIIVSINNSNLNLTFEGKRKMIVKSGLIAMIGLFAIYIGLIAIGAFFNSEFEPSISRTDLLSGLAEKTLGPFGSAFLSVLVAIACFTTAVAIVVSVSDFFKAYFKQSQPAYFISVTLCCLIGLCVGQMEVKYIIDIALPALMFIYPLCIVLILLNVIPEKYASHFVFRSVVFMTFLFSIPDFLGYLIDKEQLKWLKSIIPLANEGLGWVLPAFMTFLVVNVAKKRVKK
jgi:LIVCS family branched-chain amino acid:cation transporter